MGLRGTGATRRKEAAEGIKRKRLPWDRKGLSRAERVVAFLEFLPVTSGPLAGKKFKVRPWQREIIEALYRVERGSRVVRQGLITIPRKNGKTALVAGLALCHLLGPEAEPRGQVYSAAADREQAALIFAEMEAIILRVPEFAARVNIQRFHKKLEDLDNGSVYAALSADARKAHGLNTSFYVYDELAQARDRRLLDNLQTSVGGRKEPLGIVISTQSADPLHVMSELVDYGEKVNAGEIEDKAFHATIYVAPEDADAWDEEVWFKCNPALDDFRSLEEMRQAAAKAQRMPSYEPAFRNLYLNQRVEAEARFINRADWEACGGKFDAKELRGRECFGGLDLSGKNDLTAFELVFPIPGEPWPVLSYFWMPGDDLASKEDRDRAPYALWRKQGFIEARPGRTIDYAWVAQKLGELAGIYDIREIAFDRWRIDDLRRELDAEGVVLAMRPHGQGFKDMGPAVDRLEDAILDGALAHGGNPVLTWNAANAVVQMDPAGLRKIAKDKSTGRVDGIVALAMAVRCAEAWEDGTSMYETVSLGVA